MFREKEFTDIEEAHKRGQDKMNSYKVVSSLVMSIDISQEKELSVNHTTLITTQGTLDKKLMCSLITTEATMHQDMIGDITMHLLLTTGEIADFPLDIREKQI